MVGEEAEEAALDSDPPQITHETRKLIKQLPHQGIVRSQAPKKAETPAVSAEIRHGFHLDIKTENPVKSVFLSESSSFASHRGRRVPQPGAASSLSQTRQET